MWGRCLVCEANFLAALSSIITLCTSRFGQCTLDWKLSTARALPCTLAVPPVDAVPRLRRVHTVSIVCVRGCSPTRVAYGGRCCGLITSPHRLCCSAALRGGFLRPGRLPR